MSESLSYILTKLEKNHLRSKRGTYEYKQRFHGFLMRVSGKVTLVLRTPLLTSNTDMRVIA